ncbi:MAG: ABC transporter ATP-binding protein [Alphaproteobacteria bacterium]|nr:ABC transporter ATP-binding protein [Alphaproteobacteria bacterium]
MAISDAISINHLSKTFADIRAVDDVSFAVRKGEIYGFMGHNGAGKTTTIRMLLGLLKPTGGAASVLGHDIVGQSLAVRQLCGFLPGSYALPKDLTPLSFLRYVGAMFGLSGKGLDLRIDALLEQFELGAVRHKRLGQFSTGMSQKVGLAQALINDPQVLLLDEPTAGLDPIGRHDFLEFIRTLARDRGVTVLFSTHILTDIERICERVAILHRGKLVASGELGTLKAQYHADGMDDLYLTLARAAA